MDLFQFNRDKIFYYCLLLLATLSVASLLFIIYFLVAESTTALSQIKFNQFFFDESWHPNEGGFLLLPMILGSLLITLGAMLLSIPLGILAAVFCQFYAPAWLSQILQRIVEILSGIPSVVYGFWGIVVIVPLLAQLQAPGTSLLAGTLVLSFIIMPTIVLISNNTFESVDKIHIQNAIALGLSRYSIIRYIIFPQSNRGLLTGLILQSGRAIGETLAVLMVCGNVVQIPGSIFDPIRTLTSNIALEMAYAMDVHRSTLFLSGLILMIVVLLLILLTEKITLPEKSL